MSNCWYAWPTAIKSIVHWGKVSGILEVSTSLQGCLINPFYFFPGTRDMDSPPTPHPAGLLECLFEAGLFRPPNGLGQYIKGDPSLHYSLG